jgi:penicillin-binding protein 1B
VKKVRRLILFLILLVIVVFSAYLNHLHGVVKDEFSKPLDETNSTLLLMQHPKALINMLLMIEDHSFFQHKGVSQKLLHLPQGLALKRQLLYL